MPIEVSAFVAANLRLLNTLCDAQTSTKVRNKLLKRANRPMIQAIQELLLNIKEENIPKVIIGIRKKGKKLSIKRQQIIRHWKKIRALISPLVRRLINNEKA